MKIELDLSRAEAHELNYIITKGSLVTEKTRAGNRALVAWNEGYMKEMSR